MRVRLPLWPPHVTTADGITAQVAAAADGPWSALAIEGEVGTYPDHSLSVLATVDASAGTPFLRWAWTSGNDYREEWTDPTQPGDLAPQDLWVYPYDVMTLSKSRHVCDENLVTIARFIQEARDAIVTGLGELDDDRAGFVTAIRNGITRMVEWIAETEAAQTISIATGLQQEKIGSYSYYRNETAQDAWRRTSGEVPDHVRSILWPYIKDRLHPFTTKSTDVFAADFDPLTGGTVATDTWRRNGAAVPD